MDKVLGHVARQAPPPIQHPPAYYREDVGPRLLAIDCTLFGVAMITVLMRIYVRVFMLKTFGIDDYLMLVAAALSVTCVSLFIKIVKSGMGRHYDALPPTAMPDLFKYLWFYAIFIIFAYSFIKLSIGFFLLRLADRTRWRRFLQITLVFLVIFTIGSTFAIIFQCIPVRAGYDFSMRPPMGNAKCYSIIIFKNIGVFNSSINIATDLLFAIIPIPIVWKLQVNTRTKVGLGVILSLGLFASATAIYKVPMQYNFFKETDMTGHGCWYYIWQQVEMNIGITAANLPTMKPLFASFFGHIKSLTTGNSSKQSSGLAYRANGYLKQSDAGLDSPAAGSFALSQLSKGGAEKSHLGGKWNRKSVLGGGDSDESILREHGVGMTPRGNMIIRTTEVDVESVR